MYVMPLRYAMIAEHGPLVLINNPANACQWLSSSVLITSRSLSFACLLLTCIVAIRCLRVRVCEDRYATIVVQGRDSRSMLLKGVGY